MSCTTHTSSGDQAFGWILAIGTVISLLPQIIKIIRLKSSFGVSVLKCSFVVVQNAATFFTAFASKDIYDSLVCCMTPQTTFALCTSSLLVFMQVLFNLLTNLFLLVIVIVYLPLTNAGDWRHWRRAWLYSLAAFVFVTVGFVCCCLLIALKGVESKFVATFTDASSGINATFVCISYIPQILTTFRLKRVGSNSILTYLIQVPGGGLVLLFQLLRRGHDYVIWVPQLIAVVLQAILLIELIFYHFVNRHKSPMIADDEDANEKSPILINTSIDDK